MATQTVKVTRVVRKIRRTPTPGTKTPSTGGKPGNTSRCPSCGKFK